MPLLSVSKNRSLRGSAHTAVAISKVFRVVFGKFSHETGGLPHQSADWFAMTLNFRSFFDSLRRGNASPFTVPWVFYNGPGEPIPAVEASAWPRRSAPSGLDTGR